MLTTTHKDMLKKKIADRTARLAVIGLGYVGLPLATGFAGAGFQVKGIDDNADKVRRVNAGEDYIIQEGSDLASLVKQGNLAAVADYGILDDMDVILICVPTPLTRNREPDISYVVSVTDQVARHLRSGQLVVLESTTYPGTTEEVVLPHLRRSGLEVGGDFFLAFSPERVDPGNPHYNTRNTPKVVGGVTPSCSELARDLYGSFIDQVHMASSPRVAEMEKLLENIFRSVNIALVNEMAILAERMGMNIWEVIKLASTKPYGFMPFYPGPGLGGHCIPIDPFYLTWKAREYDLQTKFIELAGEINAQMPFHVSRMVVDALDSRKKCINGASILVLGVAYKPDIDDARESPSLKIIEILKRKGARVDYEDRYIPHLVLGGDMVKSVGLDNIAAYDCVVIATNHTYYPYAEIVEKAQLLVDARNASGRGDVDHVYTLGVSREARWHRNGSHPG